MPRKRDEPYVPLQPITRTSSDGQEQRREYRIERNGPEKWVYVTCAHGSKRAYVGNLEPERLAAMLLAEIFSQPQY